MTAQRRASLSFECATGRRERRLLLRRGRTRRVLYLRWGRESLRLPISPLGSSAGSRWRLLIRIDPVRGRTDGLGLWSGLSRSLPRSLNGGRLRAGSVAVISAIYVVPVAAGRIKMPGMRVADKRHCHDEHETGQLEWFH